jgi:hypothetical protein
MNRTVPEHDSPSEYASTDQARLHIRSLTDDDVLKLLMAARLYVKQRRLYGQVPPEELLSEAVTRTLDGRRQWRKSIATLVYHLDRTMESISGHIVADAISEDAFVAELATDEIDPRTAQPRRVQAPDAESRLIAREEIEAVQALFADAPDALAFLQLKALGHSQSEIMKISGMDQRRYETARKKVERDVARYVLRSQKETP